MARSPWRSCGLLALSLAATATHAGETLVSVATGTLATPPDPAITRVLVLGGTPLAVGPHQAFTYDEARGTWNLAAWRPQNAIHGVAADTQKLHLLIDSGRGTGIVRVEQVSPRGVKPMVRALPPLPAPFASAHAAVRGSALYVGGTGSDGAPQLFTIDASVTPAHWQSRQTWPGAGTVTSMAAQSGSLWVTLADGAAGDDRLWELDAEGRWRDAGLLPGSVMPGGARPVGQAGLLYLLRVSDAQPVSKLASFHTVTGATATLAEMTVAAGATATTYRDGFLIYEPRPDAAGSLSYATIRADELLLKIPDWIVIVVYLAAMTGIGLYFYLREKRQSTADFFVGGRAIPFWAAGVSLYATNTSSISYIAIPAKAFETNWQYLTNNLVAILGLMFVAIWIVPLLRRLDLMSVFHYLEIRFHPAIRMLASALAILVQIGSRLSVILFLPSLAIATITGIDVVWSILIMGSITIAYTALGGMKAVIWTDVVQLFVMFGGALFAIAFIVLAIDGGFPAFLSATLPEGKMKLLDFRWDLTEATVWGFIFLVVFDVVLTFPKDQVLMQRVLSTRSDREAGRSIWTFAAIMLPGGFLFYFIGTALYAYYQSHPERMNPLLPLDATFPLFIAAELPVGVTGLIIAGIFAASMSTLSSILNSVATLASVDFYEKFVKQPNPKTSVRFAEAMTVLTGLIGMGAAYLLSRYDIRSLFDVSIELAGLLGGGFAGAYTLGMFTRRANWQGVSIGVGTAIAVTTFAWSIDLVHPYFYLAISIMVCIVVGYAASLLFPPPAASLQGLTIHGATRASALAP